MPRAEIIPWAMGSMSGAICLQLLVWNGTEHERPAAFKRDIGIWTLSVDAVARIGEIAFISPPRCPGEEAASPESTGTSSTVYYGSPHPEMQYSKLGSAISGRLSGLISKRRPFPETGANTQRKPGPESPVSLLMRALGPPGAIAKRAVLAGASNAGRLYGGQGVGHLSA